MRVRPGSRRRIKNTKGKKNMNLQARYKTRELIELFTELEYQGYLGMNLKLIVDLIESRLVESDRSIRPILLQDEGMN
jgi:hypothetical protein